MSPSADPPIGQRIREERLRQGINLRSLARSVNVSASHISQIETGKCRPSVSTLYAITTVLGVSIDEVFDGAPPDPPDPQEPADPAAAVPAARPADPGLAGPGLAGPRLAGPRSAGPGKARAGAAAGTAATTRATPPMPDAATALAALASTHRQRIGPVISPGDREIIELDSGVTWERLGNVPGLHVDFLLITYAPGGSSSSTGQLMRHAGTEHGFLISGQLTVTLGFTEHRLTPGDAICFPSSTPHRYQNEGTEPAIGVWFVADPDAA